MDPVDLAPTRGTLLALLVALGGCGGSGEPVRGTAPGPGEAPRTLLLIEWTGAEPELVGSMLAEGELPNLRRLVAEGGYAELATEGARWSDVPWADATMAGQSAVPPGDSFFESLKRTDPSIKRVAVDGGQGSARDWDLDLLVDTGGGSNAWVTEKAVVCLSDLAEERTTAFIRYRASGRERLQESDEALRTLRTALRILGLRDETRIYVGGGSKDEMRFLAPNDGGVASVVARMRESEAASSSVRERPVGTKTTALSLPNILLIVVDTLRADRLSAYGYPKPTTPNIDALAARGVRFEAASAPSCWTLPSFASILTGKHARTLGLFDEERQVVRFPYPNSPLDARETLLSEVLQGANYRTAAFFTGRFNDVEYGFARGFDCYRNCRRAGDHSFRAKCSFPEFLSDLMAWTAASDGRPFFAMLNPADVHRPYLPPIEYRKPHVGTYEGPLATIGLSRNLLLSIGSDIDGWYFAPGSPSDGVRRRLDQRDIDYLRNRYDAALTYTDDYVGLILDRLGDEILSNTIVVVIGDHGESLGDHGVFLHNTSPPRLYEEICHVPWIMSAPAQWLGPVRRPVVREPVMLVDLMPTLLDLVGVPVEDRPRGMQGRSLLGVIRGEEEEDPDRIVLSEAVGYGRLVSMVRQGDWKLISTSWKGRSPRLELYDLGSDPGETKNLARRERAKTEHLLEELDRLRHPPRSLLSPASAGDRGLAASW